MKSFSLQLKERDFEMKSRPLQLKDRALWAILSAFLLDKPAPRCRNGALSLNKPAPRCRKRALLPILSALSINKPAEISYLVFPKQFFRRDLINQTPTEHQNSALKPNEGMNGNMCASSGSLVLNIGSSQSRQMTFLRL